MNNNHVHPLFDEILTSFMSVTKRPARPVSIEECDRCGEMYDMNEHGTGSFYIGKKQEWCCYDCSEKLRRENYPEEL